MKDGTEKTQTLPSRVESLALSENIIFGCD